MDTVATKFSALYGELFSMNFWVSEADLFLLRFNLTELISDLFLLRLNFISKDLLFVSMIFAWPIAYFAMNKWLQNYAYKINIHIAYFVLASVIAIIIASLTLSYHSVKASMTNTVNTVPGR